MVEIRNPFDQSAVEEYRRVKEGIKNGTLRRGRAGQTREVCVCGHSIGHHTFVESREVWSCSPGMTRCSCQSPRAVLVATNLRMFMFSTEGPGALHALGKGMVASIAEGESFNWIENPALCDKCLGTLTAEGGVFPTPLAESSGFVMGTSPHNRILCGSCFEKWGNDDNNG